MTTRSPICYGCRHFTERPEGPPRWGQFCAAFPDGIPAPILDSVVDHRQPYPGDDGIRFTPATPDDAAYAADLFAEVPHE